MSYRSLWVHGVSAVLFRTEYPKKNNVSASNSDAEAEGYRMLEPVHTVLTHISNTSSPLPFNSHVTLNIPTQTLSLTISLFSERLSKSSYKRKDNPSTKSASNSDDDKKRNRLKQFSLTHHTQGNSEKQLRVGG